ncbi:MAG TPA: leucyl aminopeptidase family protein [Candidatus Sumerlaeota bacterium]|nr:leucyl aminopeptidase family protein [Candidatus Sumerlaeota bacterium]
MAVKVTSRPLADVSADAIIALHDGGKLFAHSANALLRKHFESFAKAVKEKKSKREWFCTLATAAGVRAKYLLLESTNFGATGMPGDEALKSAAARAVALCRDHGITKVAFACHCDDAARVASAILEGALLGDFHDVRFKGTAGKREARPSLSLEFVVNPGDEDSVREALSQAEIIVEAQNHARELTNAPHHVLTPQTMAAYATALARRHKIECTVLNEKQLQKMGYLPTWEVGRGSEYPPRMMVLRYKPKRTAIKEHIALVGKGMTYDTGGLCIKGRPDMHRMNNDMGGAAAVLGALEAIARLKLPVRVTVIIASAHNAVDGAAYHPGAILKARNGKTIYIENTDAEGRLILSDCFYRAGEEKADIMWDFATLTGAVSAALGPNIAGLFTDDLALRQLFMEAAGDTGDNLWPLPLVPEYEPSLKHNLADLNNMSSETAGNGLHAANFLKAFVPEKMRWVHVDIAGVAAFTKPRRYFRTGGTGFGVRLIVEALRRLTAR